MMEIRITTWALIFSLICFVSCAKEDIPRRLNEPGPVAGGTIIRSGGFKSDQRSTGGVARYVINNGKRWLVFENFATGNSNGLRVYLSRDLSLFGHATLN